MKVIPILCAAVVTLAFATVCPVSRAVIIDNFQNSMAPINTGLGVSTIAGPAMHTDSSVAGVLGGTRVTSIGELPATPPGFNYATVFIDPSDSNVLIAAASVPTVDYFVNLRYDGVGGTGLNRDLSLDTRLVVDFASTPAMVQTPVTLQLVSGLGGPVMMDDFIASKAPGPGALVIDFSGFDVDLTDIDVINLYFDPVENGGFVLNDIQAVPEPVSLLAWTGLLPLGLVVRRRRNRCSA